MSAHAHADVFAEPILVRSVGPEIEIRCGNIYLRTDVLADIDKLILDLGDCRRSLAPTIAPVAAKTDTRGITIRMDWLYKGLAKLDANSQQLPPDATDHAIVFEPNTGLMEAIRAEGFDKKFTHDEAIQAATALQHAGYSDWQVPLIAEASHSLDYDFDSPAADPVLYPDAVTDCYWTRQQTQWTKGIAGSSRSFFCVDVSYGGVFSGYADNRLRVRPVRRAVPASQCLALGTASDSSEAMRGRVTEEAA